MRFKMKPSFLMSCWVSMFVLVSSKEMTVGYNDPTIEHFPSDQTKEYLDKVFQVKAVAQLNDSVLIGAMNFVAQFSLDMKNLLKVVKLEPSAQDKDKCSSPEDNKECQNYIMSINVISGTEPHIFVCGTNALQPRCWKFDNSLNELSSAPHSYYPNKPNLNVTVLASDPSIFVGTAGGIYKMFGSTMMNHGQLKKPNFVSSYNFDNSGYTYFFLREMASGSDKREHIYSRIVRLCKFDTGHRTFSSNLFVSILKTQLICKKSGTTIPVYFDEIQSSIEVTIDNERYIYAVFSTSSEMGSNSALCRYKVKDIINTFESSNLVVEAESGSTAVTTAELSVTRTSISRRNCNAGYPAFIGKIDKFDPIRDSKTDIMLSNHIEAVDNKEAMLTFSARFTSIASDFVNDEKTGKSVLVLFLGAVDGFVYKFVLDGKVVRFLEKIQPFKNVVPIYKVAVFKNMVYVGGPRGLSAFGVQRCSSYLLCEDCMANQDPYCTWKGSRCTLKSSSTSDSNITTRDQCPQVPNDFKCQVTQINTGAMKCQLSPSNKAPLPKILSWTYQNRDISDQIAKFLITTDTTRSILVIKNLTVDSTGTYECIIGNEQHRSSCTFELAPPTIQTTTPTVQSTTSKKPNNATDITTIISPTGAPREGDEEKENYFMPFIIVLIILFLLLLILLVLVLCRHVRRKKASSTESPKKSAASKLNGISPIKKGKYDVSNEKEKTEVCIEMSEDSKLIQKDANGGGGNGKSPQESDEKVTPAKEDEKDKLIVNT